jgi:1,2-diacylglycerol 3-beta-galactosyltransferase
MTVVTDLIDVHRGWICSRADLIVVPTEPARRAALQWGVRADRLQQLGLPIDVRFRPALPGEQGAVRRRLGLDADRPTVLVAGGGEGSGGLWDQVLGLSKEPHPWQVIAVCGRNERLRGRLLGVRLQTPTVVLGFVQDMPDLMRASDLAVGKAGPGAIAEALATGVPLVLTSYLPGQERSNVRYVLDSGAGRYAPSSRQLLEAASELLGGDGSVRRAMAARAAELAHPHAALDIASACLGLPAATAGSRTASSGPGQV